MAKVLDVYLHDIPCGSLTQEDTGEITFAYFLDYLNRPIANDAGPPALSRSLPLRTQPFVRKECQAFFAGILPEQGQRDAIAKILGISSRNDFAMLAQIGGECAGAVSLLPAGQPQEDPTGNYSRVTRKELAEVIRELPRRPLLAGEAGIRLSLAGAQPKLAVRVDDEGISIPLDGAPSTHILKPATPPYASIVANESLCMRLAVSIGLNTARVQADSVEGLEYLLVARYDRVSGLDKADQPSVKRLHQEDFCQALGILPEMKYQNEGGPSFKQSFELLRAASSAPVLDLQALLDGAIYNFLIGNNDAHGKNFSLLYTSNPSKPQVRLAPLYDLLSTAFYPELSRKMAMKLGSEYAADRVLPRHFEQLARDAGLSPARTLSRVFELGELILTMLPVGDVRPITAEIAQSIRARCEQILARFKRLQSVLNES